MRPMGHPARPASVTSLVGVVCLALAAAGCSSSSSGDGGIGPGAPFVGACRVLTAADMQVSSNATPTVGCGSAHTSLTISVGSFPSWQVTSRNLRSGALGKVALQRCTEAWRRTVGGDTAAQHITTLGIAYFLPDSYELDRGARWFRCDLVIGGREGMPLQDLPAHVTGLLDKGVPDSLRACRTAPDFELGRQLPCSSPHVMRAVGVAPLAGSTTYPGEAVLKSASAKGCLSVTTSWLRGRVGAGVAYQWPDETSWTVLRDRSATCWVVTVD